MTVHWCVCLAPRERSATYRVKHRAFHASQAAIAIPRRARRAHNAHVARSGMAQWTIPTPFPTPPCALHAHLVHFQLAKGWSQKVASLAMQLGFLIILAPQSVCDVPIPPCRRRIMKCAFVMRISIGLGHYPCVINAPWVPIAPRQLMHCPRGQMITFAPPQGFGAFHWNLWQPDLWNVLLGPMHVQDSVVIARRGIRACCVVFATRTIMLMATPANFVTAQHGSCGCIRCWLLPFQFVCWNFCAVDLTH